MMDTYEYRWSPSGHSPRLGVRVGAQPAVGSVEGVLQGDYAVVQVLIDWAHAQVMGVHVNDAAPEVFHGFLQRNAV